MTRKSWFLMALILGSLSSIAGALASSSSPPLHMGATTHISQPAFKGYYEGHKDTYFNLDVADKAQAAAEHINYAPGLKALGPKKKAPEIYFVVGQSAVGQLAIFEAEPGEPDYSPIWRETTVRFKPGVTPVLIVSVHPQIDKLVKAGKLTEAETTTFLNCPIVKIGK